ncbi:hypothetical protein TNCV_1772201 [Trichonephila clavipes]|nr:hypothetical protein TNCV_1772201 [Trichonephila clavipes]
MRGFAARRLFRVPPCCEGTIHLQTSTSSPVIRTQVLRYRSQRHTGWTTRRIWRNSRSGAEAHEEMSRSGGQSEAKPPVFSPQASVVLIYQPTEGMKG